MGDPSDGPADTDAARRLPSSDAQRVLTYVHEQGGAIETSANLDPQWNDATAETKHYQDLRHGLRADADLAEDAGAVKDLLEDLVDRGLLARSLTPERARLVLTDAGAEAVSAGE